MIENRVLLIVVCFAINFICADMQQRKTESIVVYKVENIPTVNTTLSELNVTNSTGTPYVEARGELLVPAESNISCVGALTIPPESETNRSVVTNMDENTSDNKKLLESETKHTEDNSEEKTEVVFDHDQLDQLSAELLSAVKSKFEVQQKIAEFARMVHVQNGLNSQKALSTVSKKILDNLKLNSNPSELNFLMTGIAQTAAEVAIISSISDVNIAAGLNGKDQTEIDLLRNRRALVGETHIEKKVGEKDLVPQKNNMLSPSDNGLRGANNNSSLPRGPDGKWTKFSILNMSRKKPISVIFRKKPIIRMKNGTTFEGFLSIMNIEVSPFLGKEGMQALRDASDIIRLTTATILASRRVFEAYAHVKSLMKTANSGPVSDTNAHERAKELARTATEEAKLAKSTAAIAERALSDLTKFAGSNGMVNRVMVEIIQANAVAKTLSNIAAEKALIAFKEAFTDSLAA